MTAILHHVLYKFVAILISVPMLLGINIDLLKADDTNWNTNYAYVFVHGLSGWGSYDNIYKIMQLPSLPQTAPGTEPASFMLSLRVQK